MPTHVIGLGTATPAGRLTQHEAVDHAAARCCVDGRQRRTLGRVYRQAQVQQRASVLTAADDRHGLARFYPSPNGRGPASPTTGQRMAEYARHAGALAHAAGAAALADAGVEPGAVGQLVTASCTGFDSPGLDIELIASLGLPGDVGRTHIGFMGCHAAINALRVADALARQRPGDAVLLCTAELCSLHMQYGFKRDHIVANALFGDGSGAMVLRAGSEGRASTWRVVDTRSTLVPQTRQAMGWRIGDHGFEMTLSAEVPALIEAHLPEVVEGMLRRHGLGVSEVGSWAIHPGGPRVLDAVQRCLGLGPGGAAASRRVLSERGNMSSASVLFILDELRRADAPRPTVMLALGPGLSIEAALLG